MWPPPPPPGHMNHTLLILIYEMSLKLLTFRKPLAHITQISPTELTAFEHNSAFVPKKITVDHLKGSRMSYYSISDHYVSYKDISFASFFIFAHTGLVVTACITNSWFLNSHFPQKCLYPLTKLQPQWQQANILDFSTGSRRYPTRTHPRQIDAGTVGSLVWILTFAIGKAPRCSTRLFCKRRK
jgi:hypothetical protein